MITTKNPFKTEVTYESVTTERLTSLIKSEVQLQIVKDYIKNETYLDKKTLLILLGEKPKSAKK